MNTLYRLGLGILFAFLTPSLFAQCRCTIAQFQEKYSTQDSLDKIAGFWILNSYPTAISESNEVLQSYYPNLSSWIIIPNGDHFELCHNEFTAYETFKSEIYKTQNGNYLYKQTLDTGEIVVTDISFYSTGDKDYLTYGVQVPAKYFAKKYGSSVNDMTILHWRFVLEKVSDLTDYDKLYTQLGAIRQATDTLNKTNFKFITPDFLLQTLKTNQSIPGSACLQDINSVSSIDIQFTYSSFPSVQTIVFNYSDHKEMAFEIDYNTKNLQPISIRPKIAKSNSLKELLQAERPPTKG